MLKNKHLGDYVGSRDNNFNLVRFVAAFLVLVSHAFALSTGDPGTEPLRQRLGITPGGIAVDTFFLTSGFLVTASLLARKSVWTFVVARALRIYPGLIVAVLLTTLVAGAAFGALPLADFLSARGTWSYIVHNVSLVFGVRYQLPGVFETTPFPKAVNGSLWTLPFEVRMYAGLALLWIVACLLGRGQPRRFVAGVTLVAAAAMLLHLAWTGPRYHDFGRMLAAAFFVGAAAYVWRDRIPMSWALFGGCLAAIGASSWHADAFFFVYTLALPYVVLFFAHVPGGPIRRFKRLGDYSYGLYIYGFPVQQALAAAVPGISPMALLAWSTPLTLLLAVLSWHLIEKRALGWKDVVGSVRRPSVA